MEQILGKIVDRLTGYLVAPAIIIYLFMVDGHRAFMAAARNAGREGRVLAYQAWIKAAGMLARPTIWALGLNAGALLTFTVVALLVRSNTAGMAMFTVTMAVLIAAHIVLAMRQRSAIFRAARDPAGVMQRNPDGDIIPEDGFRPGRWSPGWTVTLLVGSWVITGVFLMVLMALEEALVFGSMGAVALLIGWLYARVALGILAGVLKALVDFAEGTSTFLQDQLAVLAPGITWNNLRQFVVPVNVLDQKRWAEGSVKALNNIVAYALLIDLIAIFIGLFLDSAMNGLKFSVMVVGLIQLAMVVALFWSEKAEPLVAWLRDLFAHRLAVIIGPIVVPLAIYRHFMPVDGKEQVGWWAEMVGRFGLGTAGIDVAGGWANIGLMFVGIAGFALAGGLGFWLSRNRGFMWQLAGSLFAMSGLIFAGLVPYALAGLAANLLEDKTIDLPARKADPKMPRDVFAYQDGTAVIVSWTHTEGGVSWYDVERRTPRSSYQKIGTAVAGTADYRDATAEEGTQYLYRVVAVVDSYYRTASASEALITTAVAPAVAATTASGGDTKNPDTETPPEKPASAATDTDDIGGLVEGLEALTAR